MTSTVLDVTVLLLCVSASVVALGGAGGDIGTDGPAADDTADRLVTETVTVTYEASDAPKETRTTHTTRAELLAMLVSTDSRNTDANSKRHAAFGSSARSAITETLGPRTRIDVQGIASAPTVSETDPTGPPFTEPFGGSGTVGDAGTTGETSRSTGIPWWSTNETETPWWSANQTGTPWWSANQTGTPWGPTTATGTPWGPALSGETTADGGHTEREETIRGEVAIGASPPRNADTTTAVIDHPAPGATEAIGGVRIVVRRW